MGLLYKLIAYLDNKDDYKGLLKKAFFLYENTDVSAYPVWDTKILVKIQEDIGKVTNNFLTITNVLKLVFSELKKIKGIFFLTGDNNNNFIPIACSNFNKNIVKPLIIPNNNIDKILLKNNSNAYFTIEADKINEINDFFPGLNLKTEKSLYIRPFLINDNPHGFLLFTGLNETLYESIETIELDSIINTALLNRNENQKNYLASKLYTEINNIDEEIENIKSEAGNSTKVLFIQFKFRSIADKILQDNKYIITDWLYHELIKIFSNLFKSLGKIYITTDNSIFILYENIIESDKELLKHQARNLLNNYFPDVENKDFSVEINNY